jgi:hypothetical protein
LFDHLAKDGDGLHPKLAECLRQRHVFSAPKIVQLRDFNPAIPEIAGPPSIAHPSQKLDRLMAAR